MSREVRRDEPFRIIVTGARGTGRDAPRVIAQDRGAVYSALNHWRAMLRGPIVVVHGACHLGGVDTYADDWAQGERDVIAEPHPAQNFGSWPACGPRRNAHMVGLGADLCLGFPAPGSSGTWDCMRKAVDAGIHTRMILLSAVDGTV